MKRIKLEFEAHPDAGNVDAILIAPVDAVACVVPGHGAGAGLDHANMESIAGAFANRAIATLRYQFPFMQRGGGRDRAEVSYSTIRNAVKLAEKKLPGSKLFAGGHSFGGRMTTLAEAEEPPGVTGLICCSFPLHIPGKIGDKRISQT